MTARRSRPAIPFVHAGAGYRVVRLPRGRLAVLDLLSVAAARYTVHGLIEADVTAAQQRLRSSQDRPSLTAFVVATLARAVQQHPEVNARRVGRRLVVFDEVDLIVTVERPRGHRSGPDPVEDPARPRQALAGDRRGAGRGPHRIGLRVGEPGAAMGEAAAGGASTGRVAAGASAEHGGAVWAADRHQLARDVRAGLGDPDLADDADGDRRRQQPAPRRSGRAAGGTRGAADDLEL